MQYDVHLSLLTVRETLAFAQSALWASGCKHDMRSEIAQLLDAEAGEVGSNVLVSVGVSDCGKCVQVFV